MTDSPDPNAAQSRSDAIMGRISTETDKLIASRLQPLLEQISTLERKVADLERQVADNERTRRMESRP